MLLAHHSSFSWRSVVRTLLLKSAQDTKSSLLFQFSANNGFFINQGYKLASVYSRVHLVLVHQLPLGELVNLDSLFLRS